MIGFFADMNGKRRANNAFFIRIKKQITVDHNR